MSNDPFIEQAFADLETTDPDRRAEALRRLRGSRDSRVVERLTPLLTDPDPIIRRHAAETLGLAGDLHPASQLIDTLYDTEAPVRAAAADALGKLGSRDAVPALNDLLYDEAPLVRFAAAVALALIADPRAKVDLIHMLDNDDAPLAMMAAQALKRIGSPEALAAIQHLQLDDFDFAPLDVDEYSEATTRHFPEDIFKQFLDSTRELSQQSEASETSTHLPTPPQIRPVIPGVSDPAPSAERVQFSAYAPREAAPNVWQALRAYVFQPAAAAAVAADAAQLFGERLPDYREVSRPALTAIAEGALITATPQLAGFQFNPPSAQIALYDPWHRFDFRLRAVSAPLDQAVNGRITFSVEGVIVADVPFAVYVSSAAPTATPPPPPLPVTRPLYQAIFCSYSHKDTQIVERVERAYKALGLTFLRDVISLRSGQDWDDQLLKLIDQADIFQLFWSPAAAESQYVRKEWLHALQRQQEGFIRPVFWEQPLPQPPPELSPIHFAYQPDLDEA